MLRKPLTEKTEVLPENIIETSQTTTTVVNTRTENIKLNLAEIMNTTAKQRQDIAD